MSNAHQPNFGFLFSFLIVHTLLISSVPLPAQHFDGGMRAASYDQVSSYGIESYVGAHLPTKGMIRGLVIFVQTLNDDKQDASWPLGSLPTWAESYSKKIREYFDYMSMGELDMQLDIHPDCMITRGSEDHYLYWKTNFSRAIREIIDDLDKEIDFADYDLWDSMSKLYHPQARPDGKVDLLVFIFRRTTRAMFLPFAGVSDLGFAGYHFVGGSTERFVYGGSGQYNDAGASGVTLCQRPGFGVITEEDYAFGVSIHEIGHKLFGESHPTPLYASLGIMANSGNGLAMSSFERQIAGYIEYRVLVPGRDTTVVLHDYVTTGDAVLLPIPQAIRSYYAMEFRGKHSHWDSAPVPGLYIYRIYDSFSRNSKEVHIVSAEGKFDWVLDSISGKPVKSVANPLKGYSRVQRITIDGKNYWAEGWWGDERCAFTPARPELSALRNPTPDFMFGSDTIRTNLRITLEELTDSSATVRIRYSLPAILELSPIPDSDIALASPWPQPLPAGSVLRIPVQAARSGNASVTVFDLLGRRVLSQQGIPYSANGEIAIRFQGVSPGLHALLVEAEGVLKRYTVSVVHY